VSAPWALRRPVVRQYHDPVYEFTA